MANRTLGKRPRYTRRQQSNFKKNDYNAICIGMELETMLPHIKTGLDSSLELKEGGKGNTKIIHLLDQA